MILLAYRTPIMDGPAIKLPIWLLTLDVLFALWIGAFKTSLKLQEATQTKKNDQCLRHANKIGAKGLFHSKANPHPSYLCRFVEATALPEAYSL